MRFSISKEYFVDGGESGFWRIRDLDNRLKDLSDYPGKIAWQRAVVDGEVFDRYPADVRAAFERLTGRSEFSDASKPESPNVVEMIDDEPGSGFNQICRYGYLVEGHAVYCHNDRWLYAPRKCRRTWATGGEVRDEDCRGFEARV